MDVHITGKCTYVRMRVHGAYTYIPMDTCVYLIHIYIYIHVYMYICLY